MRMISLRYKGKTLMKEQKVFVRGFMTRHRLQ